MSGCTDTAGMATEACSDAPCDSITAACPLARTQIRVRVVLYDPLANEGLYTRWGLDAVDAETQATDVRCTIAGAPRTVVRNEEFIVVDDLEPDSFVDVEFPDFPAWDSATQNDATLLPNENHRPYLSIHTDDGQVERSSMMELLEEPALRRSYSCRVGGTYTVRIWLRPRCIVMHFTWGNHAGGADARNNYHFHIPLVKGVPRWRPGTGGTDNTDPRFWRHNMRFAGVPRVPGVNDAQVRAGQNLGSQHRQTYPGQAAGYGRHAEGFNTNSVGVSICGMRRSRQGAPNSPTHLGTIVEATAMTDAQVDLFVERVAQLCRVWRLDPHNPKQLCTHFEVNYLHRGMYSQLADQDRWDITWLPQRFQDDYRAEGQARLPQLDPDETAFDLCAPRDQPLRLRFRVDVLLDPNAYGRFNCQDGTTPHNSPSGDGRAATDRVSAYLRERIARVM